MRTRLAALLTVLALPVATLRAQDANPCGQACSIVFDWGNGGSPPDIDRIYGSPAAMESAFTKALTDAGWHITSATAGSSMTITVRPTVANRVRCESMSGTNTDMSCHTVERATATFVSNDSSVKAPKRVEAISRCSDPKAYPSFPQFGQFAGEMVAYQVAGGKGQRPSVKCRF
jgi:hypothetical protein